MILKIRRVHLITTEEKHIYSILPPKSTHPCNQNMQKAKEL